MRVANARFNTYREILQSELSPIFLVSRKRKRSAWKWRRRNTYQCPAPCASLRRRPPSFGKATDVVVVRYLWFVDRCSQNDVGKRERETPGPSCARTGTKTTRNRKGQTDRRDKREREQRQEKTNKLTRSEAPFCTIVCMWFCHKSAHRFTQDSRLKKRQCVHLCTQLVTYTGRT